MLPLAGLLVIRTSATDGTVTWLPSTWWRPSFVIWDPSPRFAAVVSVRAVIVPPFSLSAFTPMLTPSGSESDACTS